VRRPGRRVKPGPKRHAQVTLENDKRFPARSCAGALFPQIWVVCGYEQ
jgi:hypothetical protein